MPFDMEDLRCFLRPLLLRYNFFSRQMHSNELVRAVHMIFDALM
jgi:hypothetical protein